MLLPFFILTSPFLRFLDYHAYSFASPEAVVVLISLIVIALILSFMMNVGSRVVRSLVIVGLIIYFMDIQLGWMAPIGKFSKVGIALALFGINWLLGDNFIRIITAFFATVFAVTLAQVLLFSSGVPDDRLAEKMVAGESTTPARLVHIIFDQHIGLDGIPTDVAGGKILKESLRQFYRKWGFRVYGGAFSRYPDSLNSISNTLNFSAKDTDQAWVVRANRFRRTTTSGSDFELTRNSYFDLLVQKGYRLNVLESAFLDFCNRSKIVIDNCVRYAWGLGSRSAAEFAISEKLKMLYRAYFGNSYWYGRTRPIYHTIRSLLNRHGMELPLWTRDRPVQFESLISLQVLDSLWEDIMVLPTGNALFAHILFPHGPFVANRDCSIKYPVQEWRIEWRKAWKPRDQNRGHWQFNTTASREARYADYFDQLKCLYVNLNELFQRMREAGIYDDTMIILQGDHGSRIVMFDLASKNQKMLTQRDLIDAYSTLFAVKVPGMTGDYDSSPQPLEGLLAEVVFEQSISAENLAPEQDTPFIYLRSLWSTKRLNPPKLKRLPYLTAHSATAG